MHPITVQQKSHLPRAPHDTLTTTWQLEVLIPVPVAGHPLASHFRACGAGQQQVPFTQEVLALMNETASRVAVTSKPDGFDVVVDGKYTAGSFALNADYSEPVEGELRAAERATQTILKLSAGHQPADMGYKII